MRAATSVTSDFHDDFFISIHAAHAGCDSESSCAKNSLAISIHAAHAGCDGDKVVLTVTGTEISIHAAHAGCDVVFYPILLHLLRFQSTQPMRAATYFS